VPVRCDDKRNTPAARADYRFNGDIINGRGNGKSTLNREQKKVQDSAHSG
jgi:hypothetical protein